MKTSPLSLLSRSLALLASAALLAAGCSDGKPQEVAPAASLGVARQGLAADFELRLTCVGVTPNKVQWVGVGQKVRISNDPNGGQCTKVNIYPPAELGTQYSLSDPLQLFGGPMPASGSFVVTALAGTTAQNGLGFTLQNSGGSALSSAYIIIGEPPLVPSATKTEGNGQVAFTVTRNIAGFRPTLFRVVASPGGRSCVANLASAFASTASCTVTGLDNEVPYTFTVTAENPLGVSPPYTLTGVPDTDADGDGIPGYLEGLLGTNRNSVDSDGDGLCDGNVSFPGTCMAGEDTDQDGVVDVGESNPANPDSDQDGVADGVESSTCRLDPDCDDDGLCDGAYSVDGVCGAGEDMDGDGVLDADESNPTAADTDGDGIGDLLERLTGALPEDTDQDGTPDVRDADTDGDGLLDSVELTVDTDFDGIPNFRDLDSDGDGAPDADERGKDTDSDGTPDNLDPDDDGDELSRADEALLGTNPLVSDRPAGGVNGQPVPGWKSGVLASFSHMQPNAADLSDFQVPLTLDTATEIAAGRMKPDCSDLRVMVGATCREADLSFWVADGTCNSANTRVWLRLPSIKAGTRTFVGLYWNNVAANLRSNGAATFPILFDDFNGAALDTVKWNVAGSGTHAQVGGKFVTSGGSKAIWSKDQAVMRLGETALFVRSNIQSDYNHNVEVGADRLLTPTTNFGWNARTHSGVTWFCSDASANVASAGLSAGSCSAQLSGTSWTNGVGTLDFYDLEVSFKFAGNQQTLAVLKDRAGDVRSHGVGSGTCIPPSQNSAYIQFDHNPAGGVTNSLDYVFVRTPAAVEPTQDGPFVAPGMDPDADGMTNAFELCSSSDADLDNTLNHLEQDSDNDGLSDLLEGTADTDGDGLRDSIDVDSDNDGLPDTAEGALDSDGDGTPDFRDQDSDNDGLLDGVEGTADTDGDGLANFWDTDSDGDSLLDSAEGASADSDSDGTPDRLDTDSDNDGLPDSMETLVDSDGNGVADAHEWDSDKDGIPDHVEEGINRDGSPIPNANRTDRTSPDSDGDHLCDGPVDIPGVCAAGEDMDGNGVWARGSESNPAAADTDGDGITDGVELGWNGTSLSVDVRNLLGAPTGIKRFTTDNCVAYDVVAQLPFASADNVGLAVSRDTLFLNTKNSISTAGRHGRAAFDPESMAVVPGSPASGPETFRGYLTNHASRTVYVLAGAAGSLSCTGTFLAPDCSAFTSDTVTSLVPLDASGNELSAAALPLNPGIPLSGTGYRYVFSGNGFALLTVDTTAYRVDFATGNVTSFSLPRAPKNVANEVNTGPFNYGTAFEQDGSYALYLMTTRVPSYDPYLARWTLADDQVVEVSEKLATNVWFFSNTAVDLTRRRWYWAHADLNVNGPSPLVTNGLTPRVALGSCDLEVNAVNLNRALFADFDQDGLCDGPKDACKGTGCLQLAAPATCVLGEDLDADAVADANESDALVADTDGDNIGDLREAQDAANVDVDALENFRDLDSDEDGLPDSLELVADVDGDGLPNYLDTDSDGDGLLDSAEGASADSDSDGTPDREDSDSDNDGLPDSMETLVDSDGNGVADAHEWDSDKDGIPDHVEEGINRNGSPIPNPNLTDRTHPDSDGDHLCDGPADVPGVCVAGEDLDGNGVWARGKELNPNAADTDGDGITDDVELGWNGTALPVAVKDLLGAPTGIKRFTTDNCVAYDVASHFPTFSNFNVGLAVSRDTVFLNTQYLSGGKNGRAAFDPESMAVVPGSPASGPDTVRGYLTNNASRTVYVLAGATGPLTCAGTFNAPDCSALTSDTVTSLVPLDASGNELSAAALPLNPGIPLSGTDKRYVFNGNGFALVTVGTTAYRVEFATGAVTSFTLPRPPGSAAKDYGPGPFDYGTAFEQDGSYALYLVSYRLPAYDPYLARWTLADDQVVEISDALATNVLFFNNTAVDLTRRRWFWAHSNINVNSPSPLVAPGLTPTVAIGSCDLEVDAPVINRALFADFDQDGLCDGPRTACANGGCLQLANAATCVLGEDLDADAVVDANESDALVTDTDADGIGDLREALDAANVDADALDNYRDLDSDEDGLLDALELIADVDGDGLPNYVDTDSDGDGILDALEQRAGTAVDTDLDGTPDYRDTDSDGDGILDSNEHTAGVTVDTDSDGTPDFQDTDSDGDGILDALEAPAGGVVDTDGDGTADFRDLDSDNDGRSDTAEAATGTPVDSDGDGLADQRDLDSDGDDILDSVEAPAGVAVDSDADGTPNHLDTDSDGDGLKDGYEAGDLLLATAPVDTDGDGTPDFLDTDSDNDTLSDTLESNGVYPEDTDANGIPDHLSLDSDADGLSDQLETNGAGTRVDTDADGKPDFRDLDSDNDGILDATEGQNTGLVAVDTDADGTPDFRDLDSDNDGLSDTFEAPAGLPRDQDGDGVPDFRDLDSDNDLLSDTVETPGGVDVDTDKDGTPDRFDTDADNDGLSDVVETNGQAELVDTDKDGTPDYLDLDSDNDGLSDTLEAPLGIPVDSDEDGIADFRDTDSDGDGIPDADESADGKDVDTDNDGTPDRLDLDSDNDSLTDALEGNVDTDNDGTADFRDLDSDSDGIPDAKDTPPGSSTDTDGDGVPDHKDSDANADGLNDGFRVTGGGCSASGNLPGFGWTLLALAGLVRRSRRSRGAGVVGGLLASAAAWVPGGAAAEVNTVKEGGFSVERYLAPVDSNGLLGAEWGAVPDQAWSAGAWFGVTKAPLKVVRYVDGVAVASGNVVDLRYGGSVFGNWRPLKQLPRLLFAADVAWTVLQTRAASGLTDSGFSARPASEYGLGDVRLSAKYGILTQSQLGLDVSAQLAVGVPTGKAGTFLGDEVVTLEPMLAISRTFGPVRATTNLGFRYRTAETNTTLRVGSELMYRVAADYALGRGFSAGLGLNGATTALTPASAGGGGGSVVQSPLEVLGGVSWKSEKVDVSLVGGAGVVRGYGTPDARGLLMVRYAPGEVGGSVVYEPDFYLDTDKDGIPDIADCSPEQAEDLDGTDDGDGVSEPAGEQLSATDAEGDVVVSEKSPSVFAEVGPGAEAGKHQVAVTRMGQPAVYASQPYDTASSPVKGGTLTLAAGGKTWTVPVKDGAPLSEVAAAVNASGAPARAEIVTTPEGKQQLVVRANDAGFDPASGPASALTVAEASTGKSGQPLGARQSQAPVNAELRVNGKPFTGRGNSVSGAIPGVTLTAQRPSDGDEPLVLAPRNAGGSSPVVSEKGPSFLADVGPGAEAGKHQVAVTRMGQPAVYESQPYDSASSPVKGGTLTLAAGGKTWTVPVKDGAPLSEVAAAVNASGAPARTEIVTTPEGKQQLVVRANDAGFDPASGPASALAVSEASTGKSGQPLGARQSQAPVNAEVRVNGKPFTGRGNSVSGAIPGVTLTAQRPSSGDESLVLTGGKRLPSDVVVSEKSPSVFAEVGPGAEAGKHQVQVKALSRPAVFQSAPFASDASPVTAGTLHLQVGPGRWNIRLPEGMSLSELAEAIRASGAPVAVALVPSPAGMRLQLTANISGFDEARGEASALEVMEVHHGSSGQPVTFARTQAPRNTEFLVNGVRHVRRGRVLSGAIAGVTLEAREEGELESLALTRPAPKAPDADTDGVADATDACPGQPETVNGYKDEDGCPDTAPRIQFTNGKFDLREQVHFETSKAIILPDSFSLLDEAARLLNEHPEVNLVRVEGHTDSRGSRAFNVNLSAARAKAVVDALVKRGVKGSRLKSQGFGPDRPIDSNETDAGMARNRRTEFFVVQ